MTDLLVIGGGFYGAMLTLEAARRGLSTVLLERSDFGGATSANSLRIVHGGLRYLQSLDLSRFRESVAERRWFLRHFPDLVQPLPCLMPLYRSPRGGRLRRPAVFRAALAINDRLARENRLPPGRVLDVSETVDLFSGVDRNGLVGAALWHDAVLTDPKLVLLETLRWAGRCGARSLNRIEAVELRTDGRMVTGLRAVGLEAGESFEFRARSVVNCAGPWCRTIAARFDRDLPELFRPLLAFNLLLDREPLSQTALAVAAPGKGAQTWFLLPMDGKVLAGTFYVPTHGDFSPELGPDDAAVAAFLHEINAAVPGWDLRPEQVLQVCHGWLPASSDGLLVPASRPVIHDHGAARGPEGLFSVSGVKLTTARAVAEKTLAKILAARGESLPALSFEDRLELAR
ncbi:MAG TPA: FAD-dependent oxidoreductase [Thermoanaerobaculia bacterium]|jgi:glycerol-3-phosphate dehydrogenase|nr:FAD-dependent oxidoreductase [Thermoanaerobaculia bacterium]